MTLPVNTAVPYIISGISSTDINGEPLNGDFIIGSDGSASKTFFIPNDSTTENEILTLRLAGTGRTESISVNLQDNVGTSAVYAVVIDNAPTTVNEGSTIAVTCSVSGTLVKDFVPYTITGIGVSDLEWKGNEPSQKIVNLSGNFQLADSSQHKLRFKFKEDVLSEGAETFTITINPDTASTALVCRQFNRDLPGNILFLGDSIMSRKWPFFDRGKIGSQINRPLEQTQSLDYDLVPEIIAYTLDLGYYNGERLNTSADAINATRLLNSSGYGVINEAIGGYYIGDLLANVSTMVANAGGIEGIKCVIIGAGVNDFTTYKGIVSPAPVDLVFKDNPLTQAKSEARLLQLVKIFTDRNVDTIILGMPYIGVADFTNDASYTAKTGLPYIPGLPLNDISDHPMYANVAAATGAILISNLVKFCYSSGNPVTTSTSLMADVVHPNQKGMHYIANKIIDFMQQRYSKPSITLQSPRYGITITPTYYSTPITLVERDTQ